MMREAGHRECAIPRGQRQAKQRVSRFCVFAKQLVEIPYTKLMWCTT